MTFAIGRDTKKVSKGRHFEGESRGLELSRVSITIVIGYNADGGVIDEPDE